MPATVRAGALSCCLAPAAGEHVRRGTKVPRARVLGERVAPADLGAPGLALEMTGAGVVFTRFAGHGISLSGVIKEVEFSASCFSQDRGPFRRVSG